MKAISTTSPPPMIATSLPVRFFFRPLLAMMLPVVSTALGKVKPGAFGTPANGSRGAAGEGAASGAGDAAGLSCACAGWGVLFGAARGSPGLVGTGAFGMVGCVVGRLPI